MISVIVTEYRKRGYLKGALRSVFNQTLNKNLYEVIVVKKEEDKEDDDYARKNGAKINIYRYS
ncbi:glycosyltransferase [Acidianus sulfidivorans JP7]|uniref:Glycosyltransferase n=1 Tax=Acidianus sulfidivorans JP7 TaxID=619593 RepID=A0A2U9IJK1_9CREN|nr:glycosyltransferase [Acidianus sulfidivorans]AWR96221.1 glycosyltransferase [Acidianus sulfidivorans JP7]